MHKNYLVTGGSGFLGYSLVKRLLTSAKKIVVFDNNFRSSFSKFNTQEKKKILLKKGDIRKKKDLFNIIKNIDVIYHLAFINGTKNFYSNPKLVLDVGVKGTINILELVLKNKNKAFYYASSSEVYNEPDIVPTNENIRLMVPDPQNSRFSYGGAKLIGEILTINYLKKTNTKFNIFRPHNLFGPNMGFEHVIPEIIKKIFIASKRFEKKICTISIQGSGKETRAFCYIEDAIDQIMVIEKKSKNREIYHVGQTMEITIKDLVSKIGKLLSIKVIVKTKSLMPGSSLRRCPDIKKIKKIGYKSHNNFNYGLRQTVSWYKNYFLHNEF